MAFNKLRLEYLHDLLERRHETWIEWQEPWVSMGPEGNLLAADGRRRATVHDCVNMQRAAARQAKPGCDVSGQDARFLDEFMVIHNARAV